MIRWVTPFIWSALLASTNVATHQDEVRCAYRRRSVCDASGCRGKPSDGSYILVPGVATLARLGAGAERGTTEMRLCDHDGCTPVEMHVELSGAFLLLTQANGGTQYMKIQALDMQPLSGAAKGDARGRRRWGRRYAGRAGRRAE